MLRLPVALILGLFAFAQISTAQQPAPLVQSTSTFVEVPALVRSASGEPVTNLNASQFRILDNGVAQKGVLERARDLPIALLILVQTGADAKRAFSSYADLPRLVAQIVHGSEHEMMLVTFDSHVAQVWHFPPHADGVLYALTHLQAGDDGASIRDAVSFGVRQLQSEPGRFRRVVLLLSQRDDAGSKTGDLALLKQLGAAATVVYNVQCPAASARKKKKLRASQRNISVQPEDLQSALKAMKADTGAEIAAITGGTTYRFSDQRSFNSQMLSIDQAIRSSYRLGFQPTDHAAGFHALRVELNPARGDESVTAKEAYWGEPTRR